VTDDPVAHPDLDVLDHEIERTRKRPKDENAIALTSAPRSCVRAREFRSRPPEHPREILDVFPDKAGKRGPRDLPNARRADLHVKHIPFRDRSPTNGGV
jgi:hypothetical protein